MIGEQEQLVSQLVSTVIIVLLRKMDTNWFMIIDESVVCTAVKYTARFYFGKYCCYSLLGRRVGLKTGKRPPTEMFELLLT
jgi:hypothetical protein